MTSTPFDKRCRGVAQHSIGALAQVATGADVVHAHGVPPCESKRPSCNLSVRCFAPLDIKHPERMRTRVGS